MIEYVSKLILKADDYLDALSFVRLSAPLTSEDVAKLTPIYTRYGGWLQSTSDAKVCLAIDLIFGKQWTDKSDLAALELPGNDVDALFAVRDLLTHPNDPMEEKIRQIVDAVESGELSQPVAIIVARLALNVLADEWNIGSLQQQTKILADTLINAGESELDKYTDIIMEVQNKCRKEN